MLGAGCWLVLPEAALDLALIVKDRCWWRSSGLIGSLLKIIGRLV